jgi:hypothetical protein
MEVGSGDHMEAARVVAVVAELTFEKSSAM